MKKTLLILMTALIFMSGCKESSDIKRTAPPLDSAPTATEQAVMVTLNPGADLPDNFPEENSLSIFQPAYSTIEQYFNLMNWQDYIREKFNIELYVYNKRKELRGAQAVYYYNYIAGYPYSKVTDAFELFNDDEAYDLSPYYEKYNWNEIIEADYIKELMVDGKIYAVPSAPVKYILPRYYRKDYLYSLDMDVPTTTAEFYEYLTEAKKLMEGEEEQYPMFIFQQRALPCVSDIFRGFGVYVNSEIPSAVTYNPITNSYEDGIYSDGAIDALSYIKTLKEQGLMQVMGNAGIPWAMDNTNHFTMDSKIAKQEFATEYNYLINKASGFFARDHRIRPDYEYECGYYLTGTNKDKICEVRSDMAFYVFPKNIENIHGTVDLFNKVMTEEGMYADLLYGVENTDYQIIDEVIKPIHPEKGTFLGVRMLTPPDDSNNFYSSNNYNIVNQIAKEMVYELNVFNHVRTHRYIFGSGIGSGSYHDVLFLEKVSVEDAINEYKKWFYGSGGTNMIQQLNDKIGAVTQYDYSYTP